MFRIILLSFILFGCSNAVLVRIEQGDLNGQILTSRNGSEFHAFYGIPYAQPPVGVLRFEPPQTPRPSWQGIREVTEEPAACPQIDMFTRSFFGSEDCLFVHVFTQNVKPAKLAPVLFFIHGGGFMSGSGTMLGPQYFMDKPIVLVLVNYRLGALGFLSSGDSSYSGNYGLKDQVEALKWVQENIQAFGGDPAAVTIMGQSAGGGSVHMHTLSPLSKDLFHRAIIHSSSAVHPMSFITREQSQQNFWEFLVHTYCQRLTIEESMACLKAVPVHMLQQLDMTFAMQNFMRRFRPVVEHAASNGAFLTTNPNNYIYYSQVPIIIGFTSNEAGLRNREVPVIQNLRDENSFYTVLPELLFYKMPDDPVLEYNITTLIKKLYFEDNLANINPISASLLVSDVRFKIGIVDTIKTYPEVRYAFEYDYRTPEIQDFGDPHSEDMKSLFPYKLDPYFVPSQEHRAISEMMITYWCNFVATGDPNVPAGTVPTQWIPVTKNLEFLHISNNGFTVENDVTRGKAEFFEYYQKSQRSKLGLNLLHKTFFNK